MVGRFSFDYVERLKWKRYPNDGINAIYTTQNAPTNRIL